ncbi:MAG: bifunctional phosphoribosyl-AMP cyclohydrolase/phosphoribosyl-ATP diphosphatase HisIE [Bacteroidia bacterium]|nr:bifunctional phosphoribosyl-AMP cyclohydrolase/phosphoribosyl-ATP diphosphatase HisIE [Bacteroidia bacterium]MDW8346955.1 bifunctional phosphoribosyl-AMP cyclohydrolase/phosphoribosyl-ATP diphosphatase HisIE [Bacteroidia bacterium]
MSNFNFEKANGLIPAIVQHAFTQQVLMLGYMNAEAYQKTLETRKVTFFSRSKNRLWTKGETSGHFLIMQEMYIDCDQDTLLVKALPQGPTCHKGTVSCFEEDYRAGFLYQLQTVIDQRISTQDKDSYTYKLYQKGIHKVAQKVGEEAVELILEANGKDTLLFQNEAADLLYHFLVLLRAKGLTLQDIEQVLRERHEGKNKK